jgi:serine protease Do
MALGLLRGLGLAVLILIGGLPAAAPAGATLPAWAAGGEVPSLAPVLREVTPAVVNISVRGRVRQENPLFQDPLFRQFFDVPESVVRDFEATGSGVIVDAERGIVLTNDHVVENAVDTEVTTKDGRRFKARVVGRDQATDVAVLRLDRPSGLTALPLGDSDRLEVGDFVIAIGNPFGLGQTVTSGIVSALGRTGLGIEGYEDFIQTDASINPGNSGGALIDLRGRLIGINTAILAPSGGNVGIGFAVPINMARGVMQQILAHGGVERGHIGVALQDLTPDLATALGSRQLQGAVVARVVPGSPAERAGLRRGDVVVAVGDTPVRSAAQLRTRIGLAAVGSALPLTLERKGATRSATVVIAPGEGGTGERAGRQGS